MEIAWHTQIPLRALSHDEMRALRAATQSKDKDKKYKAGGWSEDELDRLRQAMENPPTTARISKSGDYGIAWDQVAEAVRTRSKQQCNNKWQALRGRGGRSHKKNKS